MVFEYNNTRNELNRNDKSQSYEQPTWRFYPRKNKSNSSRERIGPQNPNRERNRSQRNDGNRHAPNQSNRGGRHAFSRDRARGDHPTYTKRSNRSKNRNSFKSTPSQLQSQATKPQAAPQSPPAFKHSSLLSMAAAFLLGFALFRFPMAITIATAIGTTLGLASTVLGSFGFRLQRPRSLLRTHQQPKSSISIGGATRRGLRPSYPLRLRHRHQFVTGLAPLHPSYHRKKPQRLSDWFMDNFRRFWNLSQDHEGERQRRYQQRRRWPLHRFKTWPKSRFHLQFDQKTERSAKNKLRPKQPWIQKERLKGNQSWHRRPLQPKRNNRALFDALHAFQAVLPPSVVNQALLAPTKPEHAPPDAPTYPIIWDSGCTLSVSPCRDDFQGRIEPMQSHYKVKGFSKDETIKGIGTICWTVTDETGGLRTLKLPALYVPACRSRLLSIASLMQVYEGERVSFPEHCLLRFGGNTSDPERRPISIRMNPTNNLFVTYAFEPSAIQSAVTALSTITTTVDKMNINLSESEKELLRWHYRLGHPGFKQVQSLMRTGVLAKSDGQKKLHQAASKLAHPPMCAACQFGKAKRRHSPGTKQVRVSDADGAIKKGDLFPGQCISADHFICSTKGRLMTSKGKSADSKMYSGGCIFVDHASGYVHVEFQSHLNSHETLKAKEHFELACQDCGVIPQQYQTDNGSSFTSKEYTAKLSEYHQISSFAGVGAHHHNGLAERSIQSIMSIARTQMLHAAIHWPEMADSTLWPMAVQHAVFLYNHMPNRDTGVSPADIFTKTRWPHHKFHDLHVWGSPVYVLDKKISDGNKLPRWKPRSNRCVMMGLSPKHASTAPLVLNPLTGAITPQFHVVFDDWFATVTSNLDDLPNLESEEWSRLFGDSAYQYHQPDDDDESEGDNEEDFDRYHARRERVGTTLSPSTSPSQHQHPPAMPSATPSSSFPSADPTTKASAAPKPRSYSEVTRGEARPNTRPPTPPFPRCSGRRRPSTTWRRRRRPSGRDRRASPSGPAGRGRRSSRRHTTPRSGTGRDTHCCCSRARPPPRR